MSAAATAAGYLYASGRLRGREKREETEHADAPREHKPRAPIERPRIEKPIRVAAVPTSDDTRPRKTPTIQYRTRRWKPEQNGE
jgi:hypothetical protein